MVRVLVRDTRRRQQEEMEEEEEDEEEGTGDKRKEKHQSFNQREGQRITVTPREAARYR